VILLSAEWWPTKRVLGVACAIASFLVILRAAKRGFNGVFVSYNVLVAVPLSPARGVERIGGYDSACLFPRGF
jgi:hypothetical protein